MDAARFTYERSGSQWRLSTDEPGLGGPLEGAFRYEIRLGDLPPSLPLVGHCRVAGLWCVFAREVDGSVVEGVALRDDLYAAHGFDPFTVAATLLGSAAVAAVVAGNGTADPEPDRPPLRYLAAAHRRFLLASPARRQALYCSVLPPGAPQRLSPLTCFTVNAGRLEAVDAPDVPLGAASDSSASPTTAPTTTQRPRPTEPIPLPSPAAVPPAVTAVEPTLDVDHALDWGALRMELDRLEEQVDERLRRLRAALVVAVVLLLAALAAGLWWTSRRLDRLEPGGAPAHRSEAQDRSSPDP